VRKKILVTGSGGFIFSNFVRKVLKDSTDYSIVGIDKVTASSILNTIYSNKGHTFYIGDVADSHFINVIFELEKPDIVVHAAAESFVDHSIKEPQKFIVTNVLGTQVMVDAAIKWGVERFLYTSTDEIYGQLNSDDAPPWAEDANINPRNPYSASKAAGELVVKAAHETYGLPYNIIRSCNNYGPRQPRRNLIPVIISHILEDLEVPIYGQGMQIRDWIHVQDNCEAIMQILKTAPLNETYNISAKQEFTNIEIFHEICKIMGKGYELLKFVEDRKGHDFRYSITNDKIRQLGWEPKFTLKNGGLQHTISWYINNQWFLKLNKKG
jgi:dTDP-glucose 4,6-dehydratase